MIDRCSHAHAVPVKSDGETVAGLCPDCNRQLPAAWFTCRHDPIDIAPLGERPGRMACNNCGVDYWAPDLVDQHQDPELIERRRD